MPRLFGGVPARGPRVASVDVTDAPQQWPTPPPPPPPPYPYGHPYPYGWAPVAPPRRRRGLMLGCAIALGLLVTLVAVVGVVGYHLYTNRPLSGVPRMEGDHLVSDGFSWVAGTTTETLELREPGIPDIVEDWYRAHLASLPGWTLTDPDPAGVEHALTFSLSGAHDGRGRITFTGVPGATQVLVSYSGG